MILTQRQIVKFIETLLVCGVTYQNVKWVWNNHFIIQEAETDSITTNGMKPLGTISSTKPLKPGNQMALGD